MIGQHLEPWHNKHEGEFCAILANGQSLLKHDLSLVTCKTIGVNRTWRFNPTYHVCVDTTHLVHEPEVYKGLSNDGSLFVMESNGWNGLGIPIPYAARMSRPRQPPPPFSMDLTKGAQVGIGTCGSVTYVALQLACWMGFDPIYILGLDLYGDRFTKDWSQASVAEHLHRQDEIFQWAARCIGEKHRVLNCGSGNSHCTAFDKVGFDSLVEACQKMVA